MKTTATRKLGKNRGKLRLWIEGAVLALNGWTKGKPFNCQWMTSDTGALAPVLCYFKNEGLAPKVFDDTPVTASKPRRRKVAGTADRPIIDTNTDELAQLGGEGDLVHITIYPTAIYVERYDEERHGKPHSMKDHKRTV